LSEYRATLLKAKDVLGTSYASSGRYTGSLGGDAIQMANTKGNVCLYLNIGFSLNYMVGVIDKLDA
jgi:hypothetical protein